MTLDPAFILTNRIYEQNASTMRQRIGRRLLEAELQKAWLDAAEQARCEIAQQQQIDMLCAEVDQPYAQMMQCEQSHDTERLAYLDAFDYDSLPSIDTVFSNSTLMQRWPLCRKSCELRRQAIAKRDADFSAANDAALMSMADQYDDMLDWQWSIGDLGL